VVLVGVAAFSLFQAVKAGREAQKAKSALLRAERNLTARNFDGTRTELLAAKESLRRMKADLDGLGPILPVSRWVPVVGWQVEAVEKFQAAGTLLADAGLGLSDATQRVQETTASNAPLSGMLDKLRFINESLAGGAERVRAANDKVESLDGKWLIGPAASARNDLRDKLPRYERQAVAAADGVAALIRFAGGEGPRRYLFLSQNPDEIRPTGGFFGTYGVLTASPDSLSLEDFRSTGDFNARHPQAVVPPAEAGSPFRFAVPPMEQTFRNVNSLADFSRAGQLAVNLWNGAGEPPVDGVISFTPAFLARLLGVLGPVNVPEYGETVDQSNLIERFDFYTQLVAMNEIENADRKGFVGAMAKRVMQKLLDAPASQWQPLAVAMGDGFEAREAMVWTADPEVDRVIGDRGWDGVLPEASGDFFYNAEFSYSTKADRGLQRQFDHHVELRSDGSARITTVMTVTNTRPRTILNSGAPIYVTIYGPKGAKLDSASDPPLSEEPALSGHPAAGWFVSAQPFSRTSLKVVWEADDIAPEVDGQRQYSLRWLRVPDHTGDVLNLSVDLPDGWDWKDEPPPATITLDADVARTWEID
jgi:hypothetical protein